jgi:hypothetical protein
MFSKDLWTGEINGTVRGELTDLNEEAGINDLRIVAYTGTGEDGEGRVINRRKKSKSPPQLFCFSR